MHYAEYEATIKQLADDATDDAARRFLEETAALLFAKADPYGAAELRRQVQALGAR